MEKKTGARKDQTIRSQIVKGYLILTNVIAVLALLSIFFLRLNEWDYNRIIRFQEQQNSAQEVITAHYRWLEQLSEAITGGTDFQGSLDPNTCALGQWIRDSAKDIEKYPELNKALDKIITPHEELHTQAAELTALSKTDKEAAYERYTNEFKPKVEAIGVGLTDVSASYQSMVEKLEQSTSLVMWISNILLIVIGAFAVITSLAVGRRVAQRISRPILAVAKWSEQLSTGVDNLQFHSEELEYEDNSVEIERMITSFQIMSDSIKQNVEVIKRVADGDLTAYVDIRSDGDSLGRSLYHLVQNNDYMFANLLQIADSVAVSAGHIAMASQDLAESCTTQAGSVEELSNTVMEADSHAADNVQKAGTVTSMMEVMSEEIETAQKKMDILLNSVKEIEEASSKISAVMQSINDIASQTNLLALNAAIEAARAGESGKGFAVVAEEVRLLAGKSAEAAVRSRALIENTIAKAGEGGRISQEASDTFLAIVERIHTIKGSMDTIGYASAEQQVLIERVRNEIDRISSAVTDNAANSEETAASTEQMNRSAEKIREAMERFNLRKREMGRPYIPPEKRNDMEFIALATQNYEKSKKK